VAKFDPLSYSADDWKFAAQQFVRRMPDKVIVHREYPNQHAMRLGVGFLTNRVIFRIILLSKRLLLSTCTAFWGYLECWHVAAWNKIKFTKIKFENLFDKWFYTGV
jgi:hypothetical protein